MNVNNFTEFAHLLSSKQLIHRHPSFDRLVTCMMVYNGICSCGGNSDVEKRNKYSECNRVYRESVSAVDSIKAYLFQGCVDNTISFYMDNTHHLKTIVR